VANESGDEREKFDPERTFGFAQFCVAGNIFLDSRECISWLGQAGVRPVLDANVLGALPDARAHLGLLRASGGRGLVERRCYLFLGFANSTRPSLNRMLAWLPLQNGLLTEAPHRHNVTRFRIS